MTNNTKRRDFLGYSFAAVATVGVGFSLVGMKQAWDSLPSVLEGGFTEVDLKNLNPGIPLTVKWRGKPVFILKKTMEMETSPRDLVIDKEHFTLVIGLCTHLGCIPAWKTPQWKCACHGGLFNASGKNVFGPPPRPLDLVPFKVKGTLLVLGEEGSEYKKLLMSKV